MLLYTTYFFFGAGIGLMNWTAGYWLLKANWRSAPGLDDPSPGIDIAVMWVMIFIKRDISRYLLWLPDWYEAIYGLFFAAFSVAIMFTILSFLLRFIKSGFSILDPMQAGCLRDVPVHYPIVLWIQGPAVRRRHTGHRRGNVRVRD